jgi:hypothetical protein
MGVPSPIAAVGLCGDGNILRPTKDGMLQVYFVPFRELFNLRHLSRGDQRSACLERHAPGPHEGSCS